MTMTMKATGGEHITDRHNDEHANRIGLPFEGEINGGGKSDSQIYPIAETSFTSRRRREARGEESFGVRRVRGYGRSIIRG